MDIPTVGMRNIKTAVAVAVSYLALLPLNFLLPAASGTASWGGFYACVAAVICMQSSMEQTVRQGVSRLIGTAIGGLLGLLILTTDTLLSYPMFLALMLGVGTVVSIWLCNVIQRPAACSISVVVLCVILFHHAGPDRYLYALNRMFETAVGILVAVVVNRVLPDHRKPEDATSGTGP